MYFGQTVALMHKSLNRPIEAGLVNMADVNGRVTGIKAISVMGQPQLTGDELDEYIIYGTQEVI